MHVDFNHYLIVVKTELQENWKPATAMVGVAIIVTVVWGKVAVVGFGLVVFGSYVAFGPSIKVMTYLDMKGFLIIGALVGNGYFGIINPMLLNYYAAACMLVREWNFWNIHSELSSHKDGLQVLNEQMQRAGVDWQQKITAIELQFTTLLQKAGVTAPEVHEFRDQVAALQSPIDRNLQEIESRLAYLSQLATAVLDNKALRERSRLAAQAEADLVKAKKEHVTLQRQYSSAMKDLQELNQQLAAALDGLKGQEILKGQQIQVLTRVIGQLQSFKI